MALNFGVLQTATPVSAFFKGQEDVAQNALAQQKMAQEQEMNALRRQQMQIEMEGARLGQERTRGLMAAAEEDRARARRAERVGMFRDRLLRAATPEAAREIVKMQYADPDLAPVLSQASTLEQALAEVPDDPTQFQTYRQQEAMGMGEWMKSQLPKTVGNAIYLPAENRFVTPPQRELAPPPAPAPVRLRPGESLVSREGELITSLPPAPPRVSARGAAAPAEKPPTPAQAAKTEAQTKARQALSQDLQTVLGYYNSLNEMGGMTSPTRSIAENVIASARATGLGQEAERTMATKAQTLRDNISNSRQRLLVHIKNATGASAQQMNSNVELQTWLNALTNPRQSIETVRETLGQLDSVIASVQNQVNKESQARPAAAAPAPTSGSRDLGGGFRLRED